MPQIFSYFYLGLGRGARWAFLISSPRLVLPLSSSGDQGNNQPESRASCPRHPEPSLLGLRLESLPGCPELPGHATAHGSSRQPCLQSLQWSLAEPKAGALSHSPLRQPLRAGLASWSSKVPGHVTVSDRQRQFPWTTDKQAPGNFPPTTCHVAVKHSHKDARCRGQKNPLFYSNVYIVVFVDL